MGLHFKNIPFDQHPTAPHSAKASENHPFGYIPILILREINGNKVDLKLRESQAIVRYIDRLVPEPSLHLQEDDAILPELLWEFVSLVAAYGQFTAHESGCLLSGLTKCFKGTTRWRLA